MSQEKEQKQEVKCRCTECKNEWSQVEPEAKEIVT